MHPFQINVSVNTPAAGVIVELFVPDGEKVKTGEKLFKLKVSGQYIYIECVHVVCVVFFFFS